MDRVDCGVSLKRELTAALAFAALIAPAFAWSHGTTQITLGDNQFYTVGQYGAYMAPFNKGSYVYGVDYTESIALYSNLFPNTTTITWNWGSTPSSSIYGFLAVDYGNYNGTVVQSPISTKQVSGITSLVEQPSLVFSGPVNNYDVINDLFLWSTSGQAVADFEIEIFLHTPNFSATYVNGATQIGSLTSSGVTWTVAIDNTASPHDILIMPTNQADFSSGSLDIKAILSYLVSKGTITNSEWFTGLGLGVEPKVGSGSAQINSLSFTYN